LLLALSFFGFGQCSNIAACKQIKQKSFIRMMRLRPDCPFSLATSIGVLLSRRSISYFGLLSHSTFALTVFLPLITRALGRHIVLN